MGIFSKIFGSDVEGADAPSEEPTSEGREAPPPSMAVAPTVRGAPPVPIGAPLERPPHVDEERGPSTHRGPRPAISPTVDARLLLAQPPRAPADPALSKQTLAAGTAIPPKKPPKAGQTSHVPSPPTTAPTRPAARIAATPMVAVGATKAPPKTPRAGSAPTLELEPIEPVIRSGPKKASSEPDDIDNAFGRIVSVVPTGGAGKLAEDRAMKEANAKLFREMAVDHAKPLREFMIDLSVGSTTKQWLDVVRPAARSILKGASELGEPAVAGALATLVGSLDRVAETAGSTVAEVDRVALLRDYEALVRALPRAFDVKNDRARREPLIVRHLLSQVPGMYKVGMDKLFAAGLSTLDGLCRSSIDDLTSLAGLEAETASAVVDRFRSYWRERTEKPPAKLVAEAKERLRSLTENLRRAHEELLEAEDAEDRARKRRARAARRAHALEMNVVLVQLGEVDLVAELERSATEHRIERVRTFIDQAGLHP